jgi:hypothetical protein
MEPENIMPSHAEENTNRVAIINREIESSLQTIHQGKKILVNFITLYITGVFGFFYYGAYVQGKLNSAKLTNFPNDLLILGLIGVLLVLIIFLFGWALLGFVTRTIFGTIKQYKHISYMRNLSALIFPPGIFEANCLNPIGTTTLSGDPKLPMRIAVSLPYLFGLVNFMFLSSSFYFLKFFLSTNEATSLFLIPTGFFALFYTNILTKHFTELRIVQEITPLNNEKSVRDKYEKLKQEHKKLQKYKISYIILVVLSWLYFLSFLLTMYQKINFDRINPALVLTQVIGVGFIFLLSLFVSLLKVETKFTLKLIPTLSI